MADKVIPFEIKDELGEPIKGEVLIMASGINIKFEGYSDASSESDSHIVYLEKLDGKVRLYYWPDINDDEPTLVSLEGARQDKRKAD